MDTRKVTFIATIAAIVLVAVGIGYAYTATTSNSENSASPEYITLTQDGTGAYKFTGTNNIVYWNSVDSMLGENSYRTSYTLNGSTNIDGDGPSTARTKYSVVQVGNPITLKAVQENPADKARASVTASIPTDATVFALPATQSGIAFSVFLEVKVGTADSVLFKLTAANTFNALKLTGDTYAFDGGNEFTITSDQESENYDDVVVRVLYGYVKDSSVNYDRTTPQPASAIGPVANPISEATLGFRIVTDEHN